MAVFLVLLFLAYQSGVSVSQSPSQDTTDRCVVQQICNGGATPEAFKELVNLVKEMKTKLDLMEQKVDAVCNGNCPLKQVSKNCDEVYKSGNTTSGVYTIKPDSGAAFDVYCDQTTNGGGWTVFQRRLDGSVDFYRGWQDYKNGFGDLTGEFWLGLDKIHRVAKQTRSMLRVDLQDFRQATTYAEYDDFMVEAESEKYMLRLGDYSGTAGDSLSVANKMAFSTKDQDHDLWAQNCAVEHRAAW